MKESFRISPRAPIGSLLKGAKKSENEEPKPAKTAPAKQKAPRPKKK